jgi:factor associated with neutral sphingomyelinase activation
MDGSLHFWPFNDDDKASPSSQEVPADKFLDYSPIHDHTDTVNCIAIARGNYRCDATLATSSEDCTIKVYSVGQL